MKEKLDKILRNWFPEQSHGYNEAVTEIHALYTNEGLCKDLEARANQIVGAVGSVATDYYDCAENEHKEKFVEFCAPFNSEVHLRGLWENWIRSYMDFVKYQLRGEVGAVNNPMKLYWRVTPEIADAGDGGERLCYARLLISNKGESK